MSIRNSLLAILTQGPCYGYQLRQEFDRRTGATWPLNVGQVYTTLDRLERDGLVTQDEMDAQGHVLYAITESGASEAARWLTSPVSRTNPERDELAIKIALAVTLPGVNPAPIIDEQRARTEDAILALRAQRGAAAAEGAASEMILDARIGAAEAELAWLERTAQQVLRTGVSAEPYGLADSSPRRGRPAKPASA